MAVPDITKIGKTRHFHQPSWDAFSRQYDTFLKNAGLWKSETELTRDNMLVKLTRMKEVGMKVYSGAGMNSACDLSFSFTFLYANYYVNDYISETWELRPDRELDRTVQSRRFNGIFRGALDLPRDYIVKNLIAGKINFLCLEDYDGDASGKQFARYCMEHRIYVHFVKGAWF